MFLGDLLGIEPGQNCDLMQRGILVSKKMQRIPTSSESTRQVITMTDCKNLLGRLDDTIEEGKA